jgi:hypothetical protein
MKYKLTHSKQVYFNESQLPGWVMSVPQKEIVPAIGIQYHETFGLICLNIYAETKKDYFLHTGSPQNTKQHRIEHQLPDYITEKNSSYTLYYILKEHGMIYWKYVKP